LTHRVGSIENIGKTCEIISLLFLSKKHYKDWMETVMEIIQPQKDFAIAA